MPHVTVTIWPGKTAEQKKRLSDAIVASVTGILGYGKPYVSVGFDEVGPGDWMTQVYAPLIVDRWDTLTQKPGYGPQIERTGR